MSSCSWRGKVKCLVFDLKDRGHSKHISVGNTMIKTYLGDWVLRDAFHWRERHRLIVGFVISWPGTMHAVIVPLLARVHYFRLLLFVAAESRILFHFDAVYFLFDRIKIVIIIMWTRGVFVLFRCLISQLNPIARRCLLNEIRKAQ
jgi:hypothetical protein